METKCEGSAILSTCDEEDRRGLLEMLEMEKSEGIEISLSLSSVNVVVNR
jgi:hypothetical protein